MVALVDTTFRLIDRQGREHRDILYTWIYVNCCLPMGLRWRQKFSTVLKNAVTDKDTVQFAPLPHPNLSNKMSAPHVIHGLNS
jgi:hypothetical protein